MSFELSESQLRVLVANLPFFTVLVDRERRFIWVNRLDATLALDQVLGKRVEDFAHPDSRSEIIDSIERAFRERAPVYYESRGYGTGELNEWFGSRVIPLGSALGSSELALILASDETARISAEQRLRHSVDQLEATLQAIPDLLFEMDASGVYLEVHARQPELLAAPAAELIGRNVREMLPPAAAAVVLEAIGDAAVSGTSVGRTYEVVVPGSRRWFDLSVARKPNQPDGAPTFILLSRDVTASKKAEEALRERDDKLRQAQKLEAIGTLARGIAHDFNNLLAAIVANVELARGEVDPAHPIVESLDAVAVASSRARDLVHQILTFSRNQPTKRSLISVQGVIEEVAMLLRATLPANVQLVTEVTGHVSDVLADATQLHQVIMNLATNARQALVRDAGQITIHLDAVTVDGVAPYAPGLASGRYVRIQVSDPGKGMDADTIPRIFDPFFTTKGIGGGNGLGLAVVHGIVADHGGAMTVNSVVDQGTTFVIYLPEAATEGRTSTAERLVARRGAGQRVLLIDDEDALVNVGKRLLQRLGYEVTGYVHAADALEAFRAHPGDFDVALVDQNMPSMSGMDVARELRRLSPELPIVLVSGNLATAEELAAVPITHCLEKPFTGARLSAVLASALRSEPTISPP